MEIKTLNEWLNEPNCDIIHTRMMRVDDEVKKLKEILSYVPRDGSFGIEKLYIVIEDNIKELSQSRGD